MERFKMLIDGEEVDSATGRGALITNPATGEAVAEVALGGRSEARLALEATARAFPAWAEREPRVRGEPSAGGRGQTRSQYEKAPHPFQR